jgi:hypothetical protein
LSFILTESVTGAGVAGVVGARVGGVVGAGAGVVAGAREAVGAAAPVPGLGAGCCCSLAGAVVAALTTTADSGDVDVATRVGVGGVAEGRAFTAIVGGPADSALDSAPQAPPAETSARTANALATLCQCMFKPL